MDIYTYDPPSSRGDLRNFLFAKPKDQIPHFAKNNNMTEGMIQMKILVINTGSSSLKFQMFDMDKSLVMAKGLCERIGIDGSNLQYTNMLTDGKKTKTPMVMKDHSDAIDAVLKALTAEGTGVLKSTDEIDAIGHRVVHGGEEFSASCLITDEVMKTIEKCTPLAPLHNPANIIGIEACKKEMPGKPMVAVFDTAFHQTMPPKAYMYTLPQEYYTKYHIRKYGFHGTSHRYVAQEAAKFLGKKPEELKLVICHLGNGSSISAVKYGKCIDTSMEFTPLGGVPMGTRAGSMDPAVVTYLIEHCGKTAEEVDEILNKESGMLGESGLSSDYRDLCDATDAGNEKAKLALDIFGYQVKKYIGAYIAAMNGIDALVFTGGVGENDWYTRELIYSDMECFGIKVDVSKSDQVRGTQDYTAEGATVKTICISTNEELMIALDTKAIISSLD